MEQLFIAAQGVLRIASTGTHTFTKRLVTDTSIISLAPERLVPTLWMVGFVQYVFVPAATSITRKVFLAAYSQVLMIMEPHVVVVEHDLLDQFGFVYCDLVQQLLSIDIVVQVLC